MAFEWDKVEGYREDMTADEKLALLDNYEPAPAPEPINSKVVPKSQFDKVSSELAAAKKQLKSKMSEDEQKELDRAASEEAMKQELATLRREKTIGSHKASFLSQGYDEALAEEAAVAMTDGDTDTVFSIMRKQSVNAEKALRAKILKETPVPPAGDEKSPEDENKKQIAEIRRYAMGGSL